MNNAVRPDYCTNENHISASPAAFNTGVQIYFPPCEVNLDLFSFREIQNARSSEDTNLFHLRRTKQELSLFYLVPI